MLGWERVWLHETDVVTGQTCVIWDLIINVFQVQVSLFSSVYIRLHVCLYSNLDISCSSRYGTMRENILNLQVVLANGDVLHTAGKRGRAKYNVSSHL